MAMTTTVQKIRAKADALDAQAQELAAQAAALRLAATLLNGDVHEQKQATVARTIDRAAALRRAQREGANGHGSAPAAAEEPVSEYQETRARRAVKAAQVIAIVRDYGGKSMPLDKLRAAAAAQGIDSLTGIFGYVRQGYLAKTGQGQRTRYSFRAMPTSEGAAE